MASTALAEREGGPRATDRNRTIVSGGLGGRWSNDDNTVPWPSFREWYAYATPQLTYFVKDGISFGLSRRVADWTALTIHRACLRRGADRFGPEGWVDRALGNVNEPRLDTLISGGASTWLGLSF